MRSRWQRLLIGALIGSGVGLLVGASSFRLPETSALPRTLHVLASPVAGMLPGGNADQDFRSLAVPMVAAAVGALLGPLVAAFAPTKR
jgi:hypothetical protein